MSTLPYQFERATQADSAVLFAPFPPPRFGEPLTLALALCIYTGWALITWNANSLPIWLLFPLGAWFVGWHSSLQHETIHGHPTRSQRLNDILGYPPLGLLYPYPIYKESHLLHHKVEEITHPIEDPESFYFTVDQWRTIHPIVRGLLWFHNTLIGRLLLGPAIAGVRFAKHEVQLICQGNLIHLRAWALHLIMSVLVLSWVMLVCQIPLWKYVLCFAYPGLSLTLLRSFAEHRPTGEKRAERSAIVESGLFFRLLFLSNNFHYLHHRAPWLPWYRLKKCYERSKRKALRANGGYFFKGYLEIFRRYALCPKDAPVHPEAGDSRAPRHHT